MKLTNRSVVQAAATLSVFFASIVTTAAPLRLIETGMGKAQWMTEEQVNEISRVQHEKGHCGGYIDITDHQSFTPQPLQLNSFLLFQTSSPRQGAIVRPLLRELKAEKIEATVAHLSSFPTRYYKSSTGKE